MSSALLFARGRKFAIIYFLRNASFSHQCNYFASKANHSKECLSFGWSVCRALVSLYIKIIRKRKIISSFSDSASSLLHVIRPSSQICSIGPHRYIRWTTYSQDHNIRGLKYLKVPSPFVFLQPRLWLRCMPFPKSFPTF